MPRTTSNVSLALERLVEALDGATLDHEAGSQWYTIRYGSVEYRGSARRCLARLVEAAQFPEDDGGWGMEKEEIADVIALKSLSDYGLTGPQWQTISEVTYAGLGV